MTDHIANYACEHARQRAAERIGFEPTLEQWRAAAMTIFDTIAGTRRALLLRRFPENEEWLVPINGRDARVIWCPGRAIFVTVLTT